jgi:hypothetical protein
MFVQVDSELLSTIAPALQTSKPDACLLQIIAPHLRKLDNVSVTQEFIRIGNALPDGDTHNFSRSCPNNLRRSRSD